MNKIIKENENYFVIYESGLKDSIEKIFEEKKKGKFHIKLKENNESNRIYIEKNKVDNSIKEKGYFEFESKSIDSKRILSNWRSRLNEEELKELESIEKRFNELKEIGMNRKVKSKEEILQEEIERMKKEIEELKKLKN